MLIGMEKNQLAFLLMAERIHFVHTFNRSIKQQEWNRDSKHNHAISTWKSVRRVDRQRAYNSGMRCVLSLANVIDWFFL